MASPNVFVLGGKIMLRIEAKAPSHSSAVIYAALMVPYKIVVPLD